MSAESAVPTATIENLLTERRLYPPSAEFAAAANVHEDEYALAAADPIAYWERQADRLQWQTRWHTAHTWKPALPQPATGTLREEAREAAPNSAPHSPSSSRSAPSEVAGEPSEPSEPSELSIPAAEWFVGGKLNVAVNCVDRHVEAGRGDIVAINFEGEPGDREQITYAELQRRVAQAAHALEELGITAGDRVVVYLPVIPETIVVTLAIARIGAIHSLVFGGFSAEALKFRVEDTGAKLLVTSDGQFRRGKAVPVKANADEAVSGPAHGPARGGNGETTRETAVNTIEHVLVIRRTGDLTPDIPWQAGRDVWWHDIVDRQPEVHQAQYFDAEHPLFIIYTSGTTGKPKGLVHTSGGYLTQASWSHWAAFDLKPNDVYWCTADLAWVTAHTYVLYGPFSNGATSVIYEGTPNTPHAGRHFEIIERYGVTTYYTAPTLIRTFMTWFPDGLPPQFDLSTLRLLGTVGEAINPEAWVWFYENIGGGRAPIVDTWWQSETGSAIIAPLPGVTTLKPGSATVPLPGLRALVVDESGEEVPRGAGGYLVLAGTWPSMARTIWGDPMRYRDSYFARYAERGYFFAGDGAKYDADGYIWLLGRVDDVINVSGHRLSTIEIESALVSHPAVGEAGVVGVSDPTTGEAIAAFVIPSRDVSIQDAADPAFWAALSVELSPVLLSHVAHEIGPIAKPRDLVVVPDLPKTRSGKIMRRLLGDLVDGRMLGDTTSLQDESVPHRIASILNAARD